MDIASPADAGCAISFIEQPPLPDCKVAVWAYHVADPDTGESGERSYDGRNLAVTRNGRTHLWSTRLVDHATDSSYNQTFAILSSYVDQLASHGLCLKDDTIRTWIFVQNVDGYGAWPPVYESHVEMDGAWALFEGWIRLQMGDIDTALVVGSGKSSPGRPREIFPLQMNPYYYAPLGLDPVSMAGLQGAALIDSGKATEEDFAQVVSRSRRDGLSNPYAQVAKDVSVEELLKEPYLAAPLRLHDLPPISDGASAVLIARGDKARELCDSPVWIQGAVSSRSS